MNIDIVSPETKLVQAVKNGWVIRNASLIDKPKITALGFTRIFLLKKDDQEINLFV